MSPSWRETVHVALLPGEALGVKCRAGIRPKPLAYARLAGGGIADVLSELGAADDARVSVTVSDRFVRALVLRPSKGLKTNSDWHSFALHRFSEVFGSEMQAWHIRIASSAFRRPRLACALDPVVSGSLSAALGTGGKKVASLQPHFVRRFNALRRAIGRGSAWIVNHEPGGLVIGLQVDGEWRLVRQRQVHADWLERLPALLRREADLAELPSPATSVLLADLAEDGEPARELEGFRISRLSAPQSPAPHPTFRMVLH